MPHTTEALRRAIAAAHRAPEAACVAALVDAYRAVRSEPAGVTARAMALAGEVRRRQGNGIEPLMQEFPLSSQEGLALMCLAEALLRIPDSATAQALIEDKLGRADWQAHLGHSPSLWVNAAAWGMSIGGRLSAPHDGHGGHDLADTLARAASRCGAPLLRRALEKAMDHLGRHFVMGENIAAALERSRSGERQGYRYSFDMLGEAALTEADAERYTQAYAEAIQAIGQEGAGNLGHGRIQDGAGISIKLSALHPRYCLTQKARVMAELLPRLRRLLALARVYDMGVNIDAEESERLELSLDLLQALADDPALSGWNGLGFVVQAYQKRAPAVIDFLAALAARSGRRFMLRLVKGAYWDSEIKRAQQESLADYPVYTRKAHTDLAYLVCADRLLAAPEAFYPQFATHNAHTVAAVEALAAARANNDYEFQCLHGMGEPLYDAMVAERPCRIYAPVGSHQALLPYLVRRLLENGANTSFVNRLADTSVDLRHLLADPLEQAEASAGSPHPRIPLPLDLYLPRRNAAGLDLASPGELAALEAALATLDKRSWTAGPLPAHQDMALAEYRPVRNPARPDDRVGMVQEAAADAAAQAIHFALAHSSSWRETLAASRAATLEQAADLLQAHRPELISLCIREAGKTWANALGEVREAVDFLRYYAAQLRQYAPPCLGDAAPLVCISPWNFPLAIFIGQVAAGLAAGRPVIAKPAEQTPLVAARATALLHQAGIPPAALQLLPGRGESLGAALCADPRIAGVLFTGSTEVAQHIHQQLAARPMAATAPVFIAETGGINAMVVDASALPEQVVQDVLVSGFDSAGQRCSALRLLCLQEEMADALLALLRQAMAEWRLGDPRRLDTDIGPVIDAEARERLESHIARLAAAGCRVFRPPAALPANTDPAATFVAPTLIEIDEPAQLPDEVFGPVIHVLRYRQADLEGLIEAINGLGYGLTFGLHSRIDSTVTRVVSRIRAGNVYINRNMVGAVVGVQPFGGEGLSGTGPKAGGPLMLPSLLDLPQLPPAALGGSGAAAALHRPALDGLAEWAAKHGREALGTACAEYAAESLAGREIRLPGPTGEDNRLHFVARGTLLCVGPTEETRLQQLAAALATDNRALLPDDAAGRSLLADLPTAVRKQVALVAGEPARHDAVASSTTAPSPAMADRPGAVLCAQDAVAEAAAWRRYLAASPGPRVPVICARNGRYPLYRLVLERSLCINTAATGGNAGLLSLEE
ncbi:bifunctional protein PutA [Azospira sp. I13]|uniref:bifunctional proline dehydrogenase/L-glutamate gamma-semialdehyde dehydrogenase PutA n=1 Tax=Azospira sp. I13 TaxID=1765050 RepID=UPI000D4DAAC5|nr:bifunctional proline dehydrogenase/L-glutamate gamma-semialdehyde dehydrogenase PutA [Azospira sp. I13]GBG02986.1 bifunctional protein PutA [Azospira sp. I13]